MKMLTPAVKAKLESQHGIDLQCIVKVEWPSPLPTTYYGDKTTQIGTIAVQGAIAQMTEITSEVGPEYGGTTSGVTVHLIDPTGLLYLHVMHPTAVNEPVELVPVTIYAHLAGTGEADLLELLVGKIGSPLRYDENERHLVFDVISPVTSSPANHVLDQDLDEDVPDESDGAVVPLCYGVPRDVAAVLWRRGPRTRLLNDIDSTDTKFDVEDGDTFPGGQITLRVEDEFLTGTVANDEVTVSARNVNKYSNLVTANRPSNDKDRDNPFVLWAQNASQDHVGQYVIFAASQVPGSGGGSDSGRNNLCVAQRGTKLVFAKPWSSGSGGFWLIGSGLTYNVRRYAFDWVNQAINASTDDVSAWTIQAGALVTQRNNDFATYIASTLPTDQVLRVRAYRTYQQGKLGITERRLVNVPSTLYAVTNEIVSLPNGAGQLEDVVACLIHFPTALGSLNQGWDDSVVYITQKSDVRENPVDQIEHLILTKTTGLVIDAASFAQARSDVSKYRSDFATTDERDALQLAHDIAFQSRLALIISGNKAKLRYLSKAPVQTSATYVLRNQQARRETFVLTSSDVEDLATVFRGRWRVNYTGDKERTYRKRHNVKKFGVRVYERELFTLQRRSLVVKTATFWNNRFARVWRIVEVEVDPLAIALEPWDEVLLSMSGIVLTDPTMVQVHSVVICSQPWSVRLRLWTPVESGTNFPSPAAYQQDGGDTKPDDPAPKVGKANIARIAPFPFTMISEPLQTAVPVEIIKVITNTANAKRAEVDVYPAGFAFPKSGTAFLSVVNPQNVPSNLWVVGSRGLAWQSPGGDYLSDVWAQ